MKQKGKLCGFHTADDLTLEAEEIFGTRNLVAFEVIRIAHPTYSYRQMWRCIPAITIEPDRSYGIDDWGKV